MLKTVFGRGYRLLGKWAIREESAPAHTDALEQAHSADQRFLNNLPAAVSQLIGRAAAVKQLQDFLDAYRVVTLIGLGGVGKTTLALEVARSISATFQGDVVLVELASLSDPSLVPSAVATSLGQQLGADQITPRSVAQSIGRRRLLLVLDNCEHLIDAAAQLAETLVRTCPEHPSWLRAESLCVSKVNMSITCRRLTYRRLTCRRLTCRRPTATRAMRYNTAPYCFS